LQLISQVITQLRAAAPVFESRVAGAAQYANAIADQVWMERPAAYVLPLGMEASDNESMTGLWQMVTVKTGIVIDLDNSLDRRGQAPTDSVTTFFYDICKAILNWRPDWDPTNPSANVETRGFRFVSGDVIDMDRARLRYQFEFALDITLSDLEGWMPTGTPLTEIQADTQPPNSETPKTGFDIQF
jgi:hypothetical protein